MRWVVWMSHFTYTYKLWSTFIQTIGHAMRWVVWMSHFTHTCDKCHTCVWPPWIARQEFCCLWNLAKSTCDEVMSPNESFHTFVWHMSHICVTALNCTPRVLLSLELGKIDMRWGYQSCHTYVWNVTHSFVLTEAVTHMCDMTQSHVMTYEWVMLHICVTASAMT